MLEVPDLVKPQEGLRGQGAGWQDQAGKSGLCTGLENMLIEVVLSPLTSSVKACEQVRAGVHFTVMM